MRVERRFFSMLNLMVPEVTARFWKVRLLYLASGIIYMSYSEAFMLLQCQELNAGPPEKEAGVINRED